MGRLGAGGQGEVWLADDVVLDQRVALKLILRHGRAAALERTRREVRLGRDLNHPNLVRVFDLVDTPTHLMVVMEWLPGGSLKEAAAGRPLPVAWVTSVAEQVLDVLVCLHRQGILHRDLKPSNLLVAEDGAVKLADLGLARPLDADGDLTQTGDTVGTPQYMSPEQLYGKPLTPASDLYSLGVTLYELLSGERPFSGASGFAVADGHLRGVVPALRSRRRDCPRWLAAFVHRLLEKRPEDRWPDAAAARRAFRLRRVGSRRRWRRAAAAVLTVTGLTAGATWLAAGWNHPRLASVRLVDERTVAAVDGNGRELWRRTFDGRVVRPRVADLTGDPAPEVVLGVAYDSVADGFLGCSLEVLSGEGRVLASLDPGARQLAETYVEMSRRYRPGHFLVADVDGDGRPELLALAQHRDWYPSALSLWWGHRDGSVQYLLLNSGRLDDIMVADLDGDGVNEVIVTGVNNPLGYQTVVAVLRPDRRGARSPDLIDVKQQQRFFASYVPLGPERTSASLVAAASGGPALRIAGEALPLDQWGNAGTVRTGVTSSRRNRFWVDLGDLCRSLAVEPGGRRRLLERFDSTHAVVLSDPASRLAAVLLSARALAAAGDHELAIAVLQTAAAAHPDLRDLWLRLGEQLLISGRREAGRKALLRSLQGDAPGRIPFDNALLLTLDAALNDDEPAWDEAMMVWRTTLEHWQTVHPLALAPLRPFFRGQWDDAAFDDDRTDWNLKATRVMAAWAHLERGRDPTAVARQARGMAEDPEIADPARLLEAAAMLRAGEVAAARSLARETLSRVRVHARTSYEAFVWLPVAEWTYGRVLEAEGRPDEAHPHLAHAAELAPRSWCARSARSAVPPSA